MIDWFFDDYIQKLIISFTNPQKRVSIGYIGTAILIALFWSVCLQGAKWRCGISNTIRKLFSRNILLSLSAKADYQIMLINHGFLLLAAPFLISKVAFTTYLFFLLHELFPSGSAFLSPLPILIVSILYTIFLFLLDDFSKYFTHSMMHRIPCLWSFHKVHHSAEVLTPITVYRTHPLEAIIFSFRGIFVQATSISLFVYLCGDKIDLISIYGVNIFLFLFNITGANLRHSHVQISYGKILEKLIISPAQHQIHHSINSSHHGRNFGAALAIWDLMFGTLFLSEKNMNLVFGLNKKLNPETHRLLNIYILPFKESMLSFAGLRLGSQLSKKKDIRNAV
ncbi:MAG: sterol desaturase [Rhodospirillaceae bacterium]|nr:sterol desaturase [Rhodospirillaceae bacterium]|tara:strand:+ start:8691 stop:9704 length:1014 start_codon:yes stop_codon:yes gene_type:complete